MSALTSAEPARGMQHEAFLYADSAEFARGVAAFVREGLANGEAVVVAEPTHNLTILRDELGADARHVEFIDMASAGSNPARIIGVWDRYVDQYVRAGHPMRGVGEPAWPGRSDVELVECELHELLLNHAFPDGLPWRLLCPYDTRNLPPAVVDGARRSHPVLMRGPADLYDSEHYDAGAVADVFGAPLPVPGGAERLAYGITDVDTVRRTVAGFAGAAGLAPARVADVMLASHEIAANTVRYGGGSGVVSWWTEPGAIVVQFDDGGHVTDPLAGRVSPPLGAEGGRGLFLVNQLCDFVQLRSSRQGTSVRITNWL